MGNRFTKMRDRDDLEIAATIENAINECKRGDVDFWKICAGVDAYFEQRRRKDCVNSYGEAPQPETTVNS